MRGQIVLRRTNRAQSWDSCRRPARRAAAAASHRSRLARPHRSPASRTACPSSYRPIVRPYGIVRPAQGGWVEQISRCSRAFTTLLTLLDLFYYHPSHTRALLTCLSFVCRLHSRISVAIDPRNHILVIPLFTSYMVVSRWVTTRYRVLLRAQPR